MAGTFITPGIVLEVQLMIILGVPPGTRRDDLCHDTTLVPLIVGLLCDLLGNLLLLLVVEVDPTAVVGPSVWTLPVYRCRVMHPVEELEELTVRDPRGIVVDQQSLIVCRVMLVPIPSIKSP